MKFFSRKYYFDHHYEMKQQPIDVHRQIPARTQKMTKTQPVRIILLCEVRRQIPQQESQKTQRYKQTDPDY